VTPACGNSRTHVVALAAQASRRQNSRYLGTGLPLVQGLRTLPKGVQGLVGWQVLVEDDHQPVGTVQQVRGRDCGGAIGGTTAKGFWQGHSSHTPFQLNAFAAEVTQYTCSSLPWVCQVSQCTTTL
jgi:hypothetical protein